MTESMNDLELRKIELEKVTSNLASLNLKLNIIEDEFAKASSWYEANNDHMQRDIEHLNSNLESKKTVVKELTSQLSKQQVKFLLISFHSRIISKKA